MTPGKLCVLPAAGEDRTAAAMDDREAVRAARAGDDDAFAALVRRYSGGLHRAIARILADDAEAWDVVQMAFVRAWQGLDRYDERWSFSTWLYRIGTNLAIDLLRSRTSREKAHRAGAEHRFRVVGEMPPASELADHREVDRLFDELVGCLTPQQRSAFVLRELQGLDTADVAKALRCTTTTV
ncbi:MAG TPA: sigma-70 family RNA polymerase sigma factor, partial [Thermoanaerobaculales bacterium]|nr:sigma-70 family RNA polymerase sigma factor [Thermoanaerobaculales bacterium]